MHGLSDKDWEALSAYHDGELSAPARAALEARLAQEPALARALAEITGLSDGLRRLHPVPQPAAVAEALTPPIAPPANLPHARVGDEHRLAAASHRRHRPAMSFSGARNGGASAVVWLSEHSRP